jgi:ParB-like chromosome segregation protein Spo0J
MTTKRKSDSLAELAELANACLKYHPCANVFPLMEGAEFDEFCADIKARGQIEPIITYAGMILDGRNRYRACLKNKREPVIKAGDDWIKDPAAYVRSANIHRRHLKAKEKHKALVDLLNTHPEKSDRSIAKEIGVSPTTVGVVRKEVEATVQSGQLSVPDRKRVGADGKARRQPAKKTSAKAGERTRKAMERRERREAERKRKAEAKAKEREIRESAAQAVTNQLAADLIKAGLAQRVREYLTSPEHRSYDLVCAIDDRLNGDESESEGNGSDPQASADQRKAEHGVLDSAKPEEATGATTDDGIPEFLRRQPTGPTP